MQHIGTKKLETQRLILRKFTLDDANAMFNNWASDEDVTKFLVWPAHKTIEDTKTVLEQWISQYSDDNFYNWAIILKDTMELVGNIGVVSQNDNIKMVHIGYCISKKFWHKGICSEALAKVIEFFFDKTDINRIESRHDPNNSNSGKVMKKCNMQYEGTQRQADRNNQGIVDCSYYAILREDYKK